LRYSAIVAGDPYSSVFGYHEVFHAYVCAATACQYVAIARFIT
jgi:hemolysin III